MTDNEPQFTPAEFSRVGTTLRGRVHLDLAHPNPDISSGVEQACGAVPPVDAGDVRGGGAPDIQASAGTGRHVSTTLQRGATTRWTQVPPIGGVLRQQFTGTVPRAAGGVGLLPINYIDADIPSAAHRASSAKQTQLLPNREAETP